MYSNAESMNDLMCTIVVVVVAGGVDNKLVYMNNNDNDVDDDQMEDEFLHKHLQIHDEMMLMFHRNSNDVDYVPYEDLNLIYSS